MDTTQNFTLDVYDTIALPIGHISIVTTRFVATHFIRNLDRCVITSAEFTWNTTNYKKR